MIDFDSVLHQVGGFGRYQLFTAIVVGYYGMLVAHYSLVLGFQISQLLIYVGHWPVFLESHLSFCVYLCDTRLSL